MNNIQLCNFRCFSDTGSIHFSPLTFLLGKNSTGKSSLLKLLPLLSQSTGKYVNGALLWYGDNVDLGNFKNVLKDGSEEMTFRFEIQDSEIDLRRGALQFKREGIVSCEIVIHSINEKEEFFSSIRINSDKYSFECNYEDILIKYLRVGGVTSKEFPDEELFSIGTNSILPRILFTDEPWDSSQSAQREMDAMVAGLDNNDHPIRRVFMNFDSRKRAIKTLEGEGLSKEDASRYYDLQVYSKANEIIDAINRYLLTLASRIFYTKPVRAMGERFYRYRNIAVNRVDPSGENLAMYLGNLSKERLDDLNGFLGENFHFTVRTTGEGNLEILITTNDGERNLVDMGFGYTQILPILVSIWDVRKKMSPVGDRNQFNRMRIPYYIAIEQPELHLHPKLQYDFARVIAHFITDCQHSKIDLRMIIETHSEYIINKIGEMVAQGDFDRKNVSVLLFNRPEDGEQIIRSEYTEDGFLVNWPYGFFEEE